MNYQPTMLDDSDIVLIRPVTPVEDYTYDACLIVLGAALAAWKRDEPDYMEHEDSRFWKKLLEDI